MKKISLGLVFFLIFSFSSAFASTPSQWAEYDVNWAIAHDLIPEGFSIEYQKNITRREFAELSVKLYEVLTEEEAVPVASNPFIDTDHEEVLKAYNLGIVGGVGGGRFAPDDHITREQIAVMFSRVLVALEINPIVTAEYIHFNDEDEIASWAKGSIQLMNKLGILGGVGNNKINPKGPATREQAMILSLRIFEKFRSEESKIQRNFEVETNTVTLEDLNAEVVSLLFFESGPKSVPYFERVYANEFKRSTTRGIRYEVTIDHDYPEEEVCNVLRIVFYGPKGNVIKEFIHAEYIQPEWNSSWRSWGMGYVEPGIFPPGTYTVVVYEGEDELTSGQFTITND